MQDDAEEEAEEAKSGSSGSTRVAREEEFGEWKEADRTQ